MSTTDRKPRTRRNERGTFASEGAVRQQGSKPIYDCTTCGREVVWLESKKTGRKYLVNVSQGSSGMRYYVSSDFHNCSAPYGRGPAPAPAQESSSGCVGGTCGPSGTWSCSKHGAEYQNKYGRAANE